MAPKSLLLMYGKKEGGGGLGRLIFSSIYNFILFKGAGLIFVDANT